MPTKLNDLLPKPQRQADFERFWAKCDDDLHKCLTEEEAYINFCVMEALGLEEVKRQLRLGVF